MKKKIKKTKFNQIAIPIVVIAIGILLLFGFVRILVIQQGQINQYRGRVGELEQEIKEEQQKLDALKEEQKRVTSDEYIEAIAREKLGLVDPNEKVFVDVSGN